MSAPDFYRELLVLWPAWSELVGYVSRDDARDADPQSVFGAACACDLDRLSALLFAHHIGDSLAEAAGVLDELLAMAREGRRPRTGVEMGLRAAMFQPYPGQDAA